MKRKTRGWISENSPKILPLYLAMANEVMRSIGFSDRIDQSVQWDEKQCDVSPGNLASALVLTMFSDKRPPLWRVNEWYEDMRVDTQALFGPGAYYHKLNDDALGRMLDKVHAAGTGNLFMQTCIQAISKYNIAYTHNLSDTTTISFYGEYETGLPGETKDIEEEAAEEAGDDSKVVQIVRGHNKDHRPECKQVVVGKITTEHGIPLGMATMDGNTSDVEWNKTALGLLSEIHRNGLSQGIYVADCKLVTKNLFDWITDPKRPIRFVSRVPANFADKLEQRALEKAYKQDEWIALGQIGSGKRAAYYHGQLFEVEVHDKKVRLMAVRSSAGSERWEHKLAKAQCEIEEAIAQTTSKQFACLVDAQKEYERFQKTMRKNPYATRVHYECTQREKRPVGRPSAKSARAPVIVESWSLKINKWLNEISAQALRQQEESFVLITNCLEMDEVQILRSYKKQQVIEVDFRYLKDPSVCSAVFVKTPQRIEALLMLMHVALLVRSLLQYRLRKGRKSWTKPAPMIGWNGAAMMEAPTAYYIERMASGSYFRDVRGSPGEYDFVALQSYVLEVILEMMNMSVEDMMNVLY